MINLSVYISIIHMFFKKVKHYFKFLLLMKSMSYEWN